jgi:hypothetical protein
MENLDVVVPRLYKLWFGFADTLRWATSEHKHRYQLRVTIVLQVRVATRILTLQWQNAEAIQPAQISIRLLRTHPQRSRRTRARSGAFEGTTAHGSSRRLRLSRGFDSNSANAANGVYRVQRVQLQMPDRLSLHCETALQPGTYELCFRRLRPWVREHNRGLLVWRDEPCPILDVDVEPTHVNPNRNLFPGFSGQQRRPVGLAEWNVVALFEPVYAKRAFPCWDEPRFKTQFDVSVTMPQNCTAVSTGAVRDVRPARRVTGSTGCVQVRFARTPLLSTYQLALAVGSWTPVACGSSSLSGTPIRIFDCFAATSTAERPMPVRDKRLAALAWYTAALGMDFFERFLGVPYPFAKFDFLAFPHGAVEGSDIHEAASETAAAVMFSKPNLLPPDRSAAHKTQQKKAVRDIVYTVLHELAHHWFGNGALTPRFWEDLWIKEAFAEYLTVLASATVARGLLHLSSSSSSAVRQPTRARENRGESANDGAQRHTRMRPPSTLNGTQVLLGPAVRAALQPPRDVSEDLLRRRCANAVKGSQDGTAEPMVPHTCGLTVQTSGDGRPPRSSCTSCACDHVSLQAFPHFALRPSCVAHVQTTEQVEHLYRVATVYNRGTCILRILDAKMGRRAFRLLLHALLVQYAWRSVSTNEVLRVVREYSGRSCAEWLREELTQSKFPPSIEAACARAAPTATGPGRIVRGTRTPSGRYCDCHCDEI